MNPVIFSRTDCTFHGGAKCQKYREIVEKNGRNKQRKKKKKRKEKKRGRERKKQEICFP